MFYCTNFSMTTRLLSLGRKETRLFVVSIRLIVDWTLALPNLLFSLSQHAFLTPNSFQDNLRPILSTSSRRWLFAAGLFTAALDPHRIIFGNYSRYSNSKRALPFNGPEKICVTWFSSSSSSWEYPNDPLKT